jgi:DNA polymerase III epsilon subunit-like protein
MIVVDVETCGLDPKKNSIVAVGALEYERPENQFYIEHRIWDGADIDDGALKVNGFTRQQLVDPSRTSHDDAIRQFLAWAQGCGDRMLAGTNVKSFDLPFLQESIRRAGYADLPNKYGQLRPYADTLFGYHADDAPTIVRSTYRQLAHQGIAVPSEFGRIGSLNKALEFVGIPREPDPHNALTGAKMAAEVICRCERGTPFFKEHAVYPLPAYLIR